MRVTIARWVGVVVLALLVLCGSARADEKALLARQPTLSKTTIVFSWGGYLWSVPREGGEARQAAINQMQNDPGNNNRRQ